MNDTYPKIGSDMQLNLEKDDREDWQKEYYWYIKRPDFSVNLPYRYGFFSYVKEECKKKGIEVTYYSGKIAFKKENQRSIIQSVIFKGLQYDKIKRYQQDKNKVIKYFTKSNTIMGVCIGSDVVPNENENTANIQNCFTLYIREQFIEQYVRNVFIGKAHKPQRFIIFNTKQALMEALEKDFNIII